MKSGLLIVLLFYITMAGTGQVSINSDNSPPDPSAMLDVKSTTKGLLAPRVALTATNVAAPVNAPAAGLLVYNTATAGTPPYNVKPGIYVWNGTQWISDHLLTGVNVGDMQYWNGSQWVIIPAGTAYAQQLFFCNGVPTWGGCPPVLSTQPVTNITHNTATCGGTITLNGGSEILSKGVCWSTSPNPTINDNKTTSGILSNSFPAFMTGLEPNTLYYVRSFATNYGSTGYGNQFSFTTLCAVVGVTVSPSVNPVCTGNTVTLTATPIYGGSSPSYQWRLGGVDIIGATASTYTYIPANGDVISCRLLSSLTCTAVNPGVSAPLAITVTSAIPATPTGTYTSTTNSLLWLWNIVPNAQGYKFNSTNDYNSATDLGNVQSKIDTGLACNTWQTRYLWAYNDCGVSPPQTMTGLPFCQGEPCSGTPTVDYGGQIYHTVQMGEQCWLKENLNIGTMIPGSQEQTSNGVIEKYCYDDSAVNCAVYGGLYQWNEMMQYSTIPGTQGICPPGWHIPKESEFLYMISTVDSGNNEVAAQLKTIGGFYGVIQYNNGLWWFGDGTNESGFSAQPAGNRGDILVSYGFSYKHYYTYWWFSDRESPTEANYGYLRWDDNHFYHTHIEHNNGWGFSVRCMRDY